MGTAQRLKGYAPYTQLDFQGEAILAGLGNGLDLVRLLCVQGHIELAAGRPARGFLERALALAEEAGVGPGTGLGKNVRRLQRAVEAFEAGERERLFCGQLLEDLPEGLRQAPASPGQLPGAASAEAS